MLLLASPALAQKAPHREGEYGGVIPGERPGKPTKAKKPPPKGTLSWIGFEAKDGGAQVFFQSPGPFDVQQRVEGATLVVDLTLTRLGANTWRQVDTRFFDNPLSGIVAKAARGSKKSRTGASISVRIKFKNPKDAREATMRSETGPDGMYYVYLTFPQGSEGGAATPTAGAAGTKRAADVEQ